MADEVEGNNDDDWVPIDLRTRKFPRVIQVASVIWIGIGGLLIFVVVAFYSIMVLFMLGMRIQMPHYQLRSDLADLGVLGFVGLLQILIGMIFIYFGMRTLKGTASSTLARGIVSMLLAFCFLAFGVLIGDDIDRIFQGIFFVVGFVWLIAGVLYFVGRNHYLVWRKARKTRRRSRNVV